MPLTYLAPGALLVFGLVASWLDASRRRLPNWLSLLTFVCGLGVTVATAGFGELGGHLLHAVIALIVGLVLFRLGVIGGGDAKFYTAVAVWFSLGTALHLLLSVSLSGLVLFIAWFMWRRLTGKRIKMGDKSDASKFPYGVAIAVGAVLAAL